MIIAVGNKKLYLLLATLFILVAVGFYFFLSPRVLDLLGRSRDYRGVETQDYRKLPVVKGLRNETSNDTFFDGPLYLNKDKEGEIALVVIEGRVSEISYTDGILILENAGKKNKIEIKNNEKVYIVENNPNVRVPKRTPASIADIKIGNHISYNPPKLSEEPATIIIVKPYK